MSQIETKWIADDAVDKTKIAADVAGDGMAQAAGGELDVKPDAVGGANLAKAINVDATNGVGIKVDDATIDEDGSGQLRVVPDGIGATEIDETDSFTWSGSHDLQTGTTHVATPSADTHATTKGYVDAAIEGLRGKGNARALNDANEAITGDPGTVDGVGSWTTGEIMLLIGQTTPSENGLWEVNTVGAWTRPDNFAAGSSAEGAFVHIEQGTTYQDTGYWCTTNKPTDVVDTNDLSWSVFSRQADLSAGTGLTKSGNTIHAGDGVVEARGGINFTADDIAVNPDGSTLEVSSEAVQVKDLGITGGKIANATVTETQLNASVAGDGITGGAGTPLAVDPNDVTTAESAADNADLIIIYDSTATAVRKQTRGEFLTGVGGGTTPVVEFHKITAGEVTAGYWTLSQTPAGTTRVTLHVVGGPDQVNKQSVGATGAVPDFDVLSANQLHFNNNGAATGLSEHLAVDDIVEVRFDY